MKEFLAFLAILGVVLYVGAANTTTTPSADTTAAAVVQAQNEGFYYPRPETCSPVTEPTDVAPNMENGFVGYVLVGTGAEAFWNPSTGEGRESVASGIYRVAKGGPTHRWQWHVPFGGKYYRLDDDKATGWVHEKFVTAWCEPEK